MTPILLDTSVIVALFDSTDANHDLCDAAIAELIQPFVTCEAVITEACYLLRKYPKAVEAILANIESGVFRIPLRLERSVSSIRTIQRKYADVPADFADVCLIQLADEIETGRILTLDAHFVQYRWRRNKPFELVIDLAKRR